MSKKLWMVVFFLAGLVSAQVLQREYKDFKFAYSLFEDGMYQLAFSEFQKFIKNYPESKFVEEAHFFSAESMFKLGDYDSALKIYMGFLVEFPTTRFKDRVNFRIGEIYLKKGNQNIAIEKFKNAIETSSDKLLISHSAYYLGEIYFERRDFNNALRYYKLSFEADTSSDVAPFSLFSIALIYQQQGRFKEAVEHYKNLIGKFGKLKLKVINDAKLNLIDCFYRTGDYYELVNFARAILSEGFEDEKILFALAEGYYSIGLLDSAKFYYDKYLERFPKGNYLKHSLYSIGWIYIKKNDYPSAIQIFDSLSKGDDEIAKSSFLLLAQVKKTSGDTAGAISTYKNFLAKYQDYSNYYVRANYELGLIYFAKGDYDSAIVFLEKIHIDDTSAVKVKALELLAQSYLRRGDYLRGASTFSMLRTELNILNSDNLFSEGVAWMQGGKYDEAIKVFNEFLSKFPNDKNSHWAIFYLGELHYKIGDYKNARGYYLELLNRFPNSPNIEGAIYSIAWTYFKEGNYNESAKQFEKFLSKYPTGKRALDARLRLADSYFMMKNYKSAEANYLSFVRLFENQDGADYAYFQLSQIYLRQRQLMRSIEMLNLLLKKFPNSTLAPTAKYQIGWIYFQDKNYSPAISHFREVVEKYPQSEVAPKALYGIGDAYYNMGKYELAISAYLEVIEKYPESKYAVDAITGIQYSLSAQGKNPNLVDEFIVKSKNPEFSQLALIKKAEFQVSQGNYENAINIYKKFVANYPESKVLPDVIYKIGETYELWGKSVDAVEVYKNLIATFPLNHNSQRALVRLARIKFKSREYNETLEYLAKVQTSVKFYDEVLYLTGLTYLSLKDTSNAIKKLLTLMNEFSNSDYADRARVKIAEILINQGKFNDAIELVKPIAMNRPIDEVSAEAQYIYAEALFKLGEIDEALLQFLRVKYLYSNFEEILPRAYVRLSECYEIKGEIEKAIQFLNDALKMNLTDEMRKGVLEKIEKLKTKITG
jgi:TolA-binding protein